MRLVLGRLDRRWIEVASRELCVMLSQLVDGQLGKPVGHILAWAPYFPGEIDLSEFISEQLDTREVYLPRLMPDHSMTFVSIGQSWRDNMEASMFGVPQPVHSAGQQFDFGNSAWSVVIVPGLAFDKHGNRLGRGGGYYDRFLSDPALAGLIKIGVCWCLQLLKNVPVREHDMRMDFVCHERGWLKCEDKR